MIIFKEPRDNEKFSWTKHSIQKIKFYGLTPQRVLRIINHPERKEEAIAPECVAVMQSVGVKRKTEMWAMYRTQNSVNRTQGRKTEIIKPKKIKIISAWRYPGVSPKRGPVPIPEDILEELTENLEDTV